MTSTFGSFAQSTIGGARVQSAVDGQVFGLGAAAPIIGLWAGRVGAVYHYDIATTTDTNITSGLSGITVRAFAEVAGTLYCGGSAASGQVVKKYVSGGSPVWQDTVASGTLPDGACYGLAVLGGKLFAVGGFTTASTGVMVFDPTAGTWSAIGGTCTTGYSATVFGAEVVITGVGSGIGGVWSTTGSSATARNVGATTGSSPGWSSFGSDRNNSVEHLGRHFIAGPPYWFDIPISGFPNDVAIKMFSGVDTMTAEVGEEVYDPSPPYYDEPIAVHASELVFGDNSTAGVKQFSATTAPTALGTITGTANTAEGLVSTPGNLYVAWSAGVKLNGTGSDQTRGVWNGTTWAVWGGGGASACYSLYGTTQAY